MLPLIINTRPLRQAKDLTQLLEDNHYQVMALALIEIKDNISSQKLIEYQALLEKAELLIFISANAIIYFFEALIPQLLLLKYDLKDKFLSQFKVAVMGKSTASYFQQYAGRKADIIPSQGSDSENLLKEQALTSNNISNKNILIIRGKSGREFLAEQLTIRKAKINYLEVYQRVCPKFDENKLSQLWNKQAIRFMIITSVESLNNLLAMTKPLIQKKQLKDSRVKSTHLLVIHKKIKEKAKYYGFTGQIIVSESANNLSLLKTLNKNKGIG
jgi:uroporphyrinogen-III synthase